MLSNIYFEYAAVAVFGLIIGSFLNVVILRFDDLKSILKTRSHCVKCKKQLAWYDLFPFFSYILLRGKCRSCKEKISIQYPLVEVATGTSGGKLVCTQSTPSTVHPGETVSVSCSGGTPPYVYSWAQGDTGATICTNASSCRIPDSYPVPNEIWYDVNGEGTGWNVE